MLINHLIYCNLLTFTLLNNVFHIVGRATDTHLCVHSFLMLNHIFLLSLLIQLYMNAFRAQTSCQIKENFTTMFYLEIDFSF